MKTDGKVKLITTCGYTHDIINEVSRTFEHYYPQCRTLALSLRGASERETCKNIFDYLVENVEYKEDKGGQYIKTPARLLSERRRLKKLFDIRSVLPSQSEYPRRISICLFQQFA